MSYFTLRFAAAVCLPAVRREAIGSSAGRANRLTHAGVIVNLVRLAVAFLVGAGRGASECPAVPLPDTKIQAGWRQQTPLSNAVLRARLLRDGKGLVCPVHRLRMGPALNSGRRDRFHQLSSGFIHVFSHCPEHKAGIPSGMQIGATYPGHHYAVSAPIVLERNVKRLVDVSDPVSEKFQRCELLRLARVVGRDEFEVLSD